MRLTYAQDFLTSQWVPRITNRNLTMVTECMVTCGRGMSSFVVQEICEQIPNASNLRHLGEGKISFLIKHTDQSYVQDHFLVLSNNLESFGHFHESADVIAVKNQSCTDLSSRNQEDAERILKDQKIDIANLKDEVKALGMLKGQRDSVVTIKDQEDGYIQAISPIFQLKLVERIFLLLHCRENITDSSTACPAASDTSEPKNVLRDYERKLTALIKSVTWQDLAKRVEKLRESQAGARRILCQEPDSCPGTLNRRLDRQGLMEKRAVSSISIQSLKRKCSHNHKIRHRDRQGEECIKLVKLKNQNIGCAEVPSTASSHGDECSNEHNGSQKHSKNSEKQNYNQNLDISSNELSLAAKINPLLSHKECSIDNAHSKSDVGTSLDCSSQLNVEVKNSGGVACDESDDTQLGPSELCCTPEGSIANKDGIQPHAPRTGNPKSCESVQKNCIHEKEQCFHLSCNKQNQSGSGYQHISKTSAKRTFRVSSRVSGVLKKALPVKWVNHTLIQQLTEVMTTWTPDWRDPLVDLYVNVTDSHFIVAAALSPKPLSLRPYIPHLTLRSTLSHLMARLSQPPPNAIVLDPMCGGGSILLEAAMNFDVSHVIASDSNKEQLEVSRCNLRSLAVPVSFMLADAMRLPLQNSSINTVLCDVPFGQKHKLTMNIKQLLAGVLRECQRVLVSGGRAVFLLSPKQHQYLPEMTLDKISCTDGIDCGVLLTLLETHFVSLGETSAYVAVLVKGH